MNDTIRAYRDVALKILQPSERDLTHGLSLHEDAVVVDAYGFSPRCAIDGDAVREAAEAGASEAELQDLTEEMSMTRCVTDMAEREEYLAAWEASGVTCIVQNAGEEGQAPLRLMKRLARFTYVTDTLRDSVAKAVTWADVETAKRAGRHCLTFTGNGVPLVQDWWSVEDELRYIRVFLQFGIRMMHLTYNRRNMIGDGCAEPANGGLSDFGRAVIAEMNRIGMIVDCAHSGWRTSLEAAMCSTQPMVASHSVCAALNPHHRGKPDEVIRAICDTGGYIGICCVPAFLGGAGDISALLDHIDHVIGTFGPDHVAIGTDAAYSCRACGAEQRKVPSRGPQRKRWANFWAPDDPLHRPEWHQPQQMQSLAWTNWPLFTVGMVQRGHPDQVIRKVLAGNVLRVQREVLASGAFNPAAP